jgi:hypothetical protein
MSGGCHLLSPYLLLDVLSLLLVEPIRYTVRINHCAALKIPGSWSSFSVMFDIAKFHRQYSVNTVIIQLSLAVQQGINCSSTATCSVPPHPSLIATLSSLRPSIQPAEMECYHSGSEKCYFDAKYAIFALRNTYRCMRDMDPGFDPASYLEYSKLSDG